VAPPELLADLQRNGQIVLRFETDENPNGSVDDIAGIVNAAGNVMGLMPHPEHAVDSLLGSTDGSSILGSLVDAARRRASDAAATPDPGEAHPEAGRGERSPMRAEVG
jgi:phosphoribosylformylglycinamidine synthase